MMRELLLAYLFGQLDAHERSQVERALSEDPRMQEELRRLQECLLGEELGDGSEPPADLVQRTCERITRLVHGSGQDRLEVPGPRGAQSRADCPAGSSNVAALSSPASRNRCSMGELAAAICVTIVLAMIVLPAIHDSRVMARRDGCQNQLRQVAQGIWAFADANADAIPWVPDAGKDAFAGIFSVRLADGHYIDRQHLAELLVCPATIRVGEWQQDGYLMRFVPTHEQVMAASGVSLAAMRRRLAGSYAYRFGYINDFGRYCEWRLDRSPYSAILSDAPSLSLEGFQSANHGGCGQNVAYADGHVAFVRECASAAGGDHPFLNEDGLRAAPRGERDSVLGRSDEGPRVELLRLQRLVP